MIRKNIVTNEQGFIFNPATGDSFNSNPVAAHIMKLMNENQSINDIKKVLLEHYEIDKLTIEKDMDDFISSLQQYKLLEA